MKCPCKDCDKRTLGCHSSCENYISWSTERQELIKKDRGDKEVDYYFNSLKRGKRYGRKR